MGHPVTGKMLERSRIETSPRVEVRRSAIEGVATVDYAKRGYGRLGIVDDKPTSRY